MYKRGLFDEWVPKPLQLLFILVMTVTVLTANAIFLGNTASMVGTLGIWPEDIMMANYASTIGMVLVMPIILRIKTRFKARQLMLVSFSGLALMSVICATTNEPAVLVMANLLFGGFKMLAMIEVIIPIMFIISPTGDRASFYAVFYPFSIGIGSLSSYLTAIAAYNTNWQSVYIYSLILVGICLIIVAVFAHNAHGSKKIPLYGIDWISPLLLAGSLLSVDYVLSYGQVLDWLNSNKIQASLFVFIFLTFLFIKRQLVLKRPFINLSILKLKNVKGSLLFIFLMGIFFATGSIQSAFTSILKYDTVTNSALNLYSVAGAVLGGFLCSYWFKSKRGLKGLVMLGFMSYIIYHIILYFLFSPIIEPVYLAIPGLLKGMGMTLLYISIGIYAAQGLSMVTMLSSSTFLILFRSFIGPALFGALYANQLYEGVKVHTSDLVHTIDANNAFFQARYTPTIQSALAQGKSLEGAQSLAVQSVSGAVQIQATLSAAKELFGYTILAGILILIALLFYRFTPLNLRRIIDLKKKFRRNETIKNEEEMIAAVAP